MKSKVKHLENLISRKVELVKALQESINAGDKSTERVLRNEIEDLDQVIRRN